MNVGSIFLPPLLATPLVAQVVGTWRLAARPDLPALIEQATATMNPAVRLKARGRLEKLNPTYQVITITHAAGQIGIKYGDHNPLLMADNALAVPWSREDGEKFLISAHMEGKKLIQTFMAEDGMLKNTFQVHHGVLSLLVTVKAFDLNKPFTYTVTYHP